MGVEDRVSLIKENVLEINNLAKNLMGHDFIFFSDLHLDLQLKNDGELSFRKLISWLYQLYFEASSVNLKFIQHKFKSYDIEDNDSIKNIHTLRTYFQHQLKSNSQNDTLIKNTFHIFFESIISKKFPQTTDEWNLCTDFICTEACVFLNNIKSCLNHISIDEDKEVILADWSEKVTKHLPIHEVTEICSIVCEKIGYSFISANQFTTKNYNLWMNEVQYSDPDTDIRELLSRIIERDLMKNEYLPINGDDIIEYLEVPPGPQVGELLKKAKSIFYDSPTSKDKLLSKLSHLT